MAASPFVELEVSGHTVKVTNPDKVFFPARGETKLDLARYFVAVGEGALRGVRERPTVLKRYPNGATEEPFFQKRVPAAPARVDRDGPGRFPSGRHADELCPVDVAHVVWAANLGCLDLNPWPVRRADVDHPDELRVDLDPQPGVPYAEVQAVAASIHEVLEEHGLVGYPKTSGSRGIHVNVRIEPRWDFTEMRRAALALGREVERRLPGLATTKWWKEERGDDTVFIDYNQNARDRTVASAYSVRANAEGRVSCPLTWDEIMEADPGDLTIATVPARYASVGDPSRDDRRRRVLAPAAAGPGGARRARRTGRRGLAAQLPQGRRRAEAGRAEPGQEASHQEAAGADADGDDVMAQLVEPRRAARVGVRTDPERRRAGGRRADHGQLVGPPASHDIFAVINELADSPDVVRTRLVKGKITLVHRRVWPALVRVADRFRPSGSRPSPRSTPRRPSQRDTVRMGSSTMRV